MEDDVATGRSFEERRIVGDVAVDQVEISAVVGGLGQGGDVAGFADEGLNGEALVEKRVTKPPAQVTGSAGHQHCFLHSYFNLSSQLLHYLQQIIY